MNKEGLVHGLVCSMYSVPATAAEIGYGVCIKYIVFPFKSYMDLDLCWVFPLCVISIYDSAAYGV
jgi:hypothetical protein